jgi:malate dehydrogenase (oxaloacetate-decarboxylating)(NADP+)
VLYAEGEEEVVLRAAQAVVDEQLARPILVGRPDVIDYRIRRYGLRLVPGQDCEVVNPESDPRYREVWTEYHQLMGRHGVTPQLAKQHLRQYPALIGAMLVRRGDADAMLCGAVGRYQDHLAHVRNVVGLRQDARLFAAMNVLMLQGRTLFVCDTYIHQDPVAADLAEIARMAAAEMLRFGIVPKIALLSHSSFGSVDSPSALKMAAACDLLRRMAPHLEVDGEMQGDAALSEPIRARLLPGARLAGEANLLVMPTLDAANIAFNLLKVTGGEGVTIGPILLGAARPVHILTPAPTVRRLVNMTALAALDAISAA